MRPLNRPRRHTEWGAFSLDFEVSPPDTCLSYILFGVPLLADFESPTVIRTHLAVMATLPIGNPAANAFDQIAIGIGVQSQEACTAGALPCPYTNASWGGWLLHWYGILGEHRADTAQVRGQLDSEAMRKIQEGDAVFLSVQTPATNLVDVDYAFSGRMLFKE